MTYELYSKNSGNNKGLNDDESETESDENSYVEYDASSDVEYVVEKICGIRNNKVLVKWEGYEHRQWQPIKNVKHLNIFKEFMRKQQLEKEKEKKQKQNKNIDKEKVVKSTRVEIVAANVVNSVTKKKITHLHTTRSHGESPDVFGVERRRKRQKKYQ